MDIDDKESVRAYCEFDDKWDYLIEHSRYKRTMENYKKYYRRYFDIKDVITQHQKL